MNNEFLPNQNEQSSQDAPIPQSETQGFVEDKAPEATSLDVYLDSIRGKQPLFDTPERRVTEWNRERIALEASLRNDRIKRQMKEAVNAGLIEEMEYFPIEKHEESDNAFFQALADGFRVQAVPEFNSSNEVIGHTYYREKKEVDEEASKLIADIESRYEKEYDKKWVFEQQAKEQQLIDRVRRGEMAYIGEMCFEEYAELRKAGLPLDRVEKTVVFGNDNEPTGKERIYASLL